MNENDIRRRIRSRKSLYSYKTPKEHSRPLFRILYAAAMVGMIAATLTIGYKINEREKFFDLAPFISTINNTLHLDKISSWIPFDTWFKKDTPVSGNISYEKVRDNFYTNNSNQAACVADGVVIYVADQDSGKVVMVKQDNGVIATYGAMTDAAVKNNERIKKGAVLGTYQESLYLEFTLSGQSITMEQALGHEA